jgi:hypothetical protein
VEFEKLGTDRHNRAGCDRSTIPSDGNNGIDVALPDRRIDMEFDLAGREWIHRLVFDPAACEGRVRRSATAAEGGGDVVRTSTFQD